MCLNRHTSQVLAGFLVDNRRVADFAGLAWQRQLTAVVWQDSESLVVGVRYGLLHDVLKPTQLTGTDVHRLDGEDIPLFESAVKMRSLGKPLVKQHGGLDRCGSTGSIITEWRSAVLNLKLN
jgi:hypothetical protein